VNSGRKLTLPAFSVETEPTKKWLILIIFEDVEMGMMAIEGFPESIIGKRCIIIFPLDYDVWCFQGYDLLRETNPVVGRFWFLTPPPGRPEGYE